MHFVLLSASREQGRLVHEISQVGAGESRRGGGDFVQARVCSEGDATRVHGENRRAPSLVRKIHDDAPVEAAWPEQRLVENVRLIGRRDHDDAFTTREAVHLGQDLIQRLLLLARSAEYGSTACAANGVELV